jgi:hypothetical protein
MAARVAQDRAAVGKEVQVDPDRGVLARAVRAQVVQDRVVARQAVVQTPVQRAMLAKAVQVAMRLERAVADPGEMPIHPGRRPVHRPMLRTLHP